MTKLNFFANQAGRLLMVLFLALTVSMATSCQKEGCTNPIAENFDSDADEDDGSCILPREKFLGSYNVNENCSSGNYSYAISITPSTSNETQVIITNFYESGDNVRATVSGSSIEFNDTQSGITYSGTGTISGNTLTIIYTASAAGQTDNCTKTAIKQ